LLFPLIFAQEDILNQSEDNQIEAAKSIRKLLDAKVTPQNHQINHM